MATRQATVAKLDRIRALGATLELVDGDHLIAVSASANRSKSDQGPEEWRPPDESYWCDYAVDWVSSQLKKRNKATLMRSISEKRKVKSIH